MNVVKPHKPEQTLGAAEDHPLPCLQPQEASQAARVSTQTVDHYELREHRLDLIEAGKKRLWLKSLRATQLVSFVCISGSVFFIMWQAWAFWAAGIAALFACGSMWAFAKGMGPREERLRRFMVAIGKRRRVCAACGYRLHEQGQPRCPECGADFDPSDDRHILAQETVKLYSSRARVASVVNIVFVLFWVCALARRDGWLVHAGLAGASLVTFFALFGFWNRQVTRQRSGGARPHTPRCVGCERELYPASVGPPASAGPLADIADKCPGCGQPLTYGEVFIRPDIRYLPDRRTDSLQWTVLFLRWVFLAATFGGLAVIVEYRTVLPSLPTFGSGGAGAILGLMVPVLAWVFGLVFAAKHLISPLHRRMKLIFSQVVPHCRHCQGRLTEVPVGRPCPGCGRPVDPVAIHG